MHLNPRRGKRRPPWHPVPANPAKEETADGGAAVFPCYVPPMTRHRFLVALALGALAETCVPGRAAEPADGKFPPPHPPAGNWQALFSGKLTDHWTGMSMAIDSPLLSTTPNPDKPGEFILHIARGRTGLIRSLKACENFILEYEWRHLTEAPGASGRKETSGNSGLIIAHSPFPKPGGPFPNDGHEIQVCNLGNGSWYTSHGDTFTMPGSTSQGIPDPRFGVSHECGHRSMPVAFHGSPTGEWNRIRITFVDGVIQNEVNGHLASSLYRCSPRKGYISLESEGAPVDFRNMRIQELEPDPDLAPKHVATLLPEEMTTDYLAPGKPVPLPSGNFIVVADVAGPVPLASLVSGIGLPEQPVSGRVRIDIRDGRVSVSSNEKETLPAQNLPADARGVLHLETGKFGHVLLCKPRRS
jgi:hypothetical protein